MAIPTEATERQLWMQPNEAKRYQKKVIACENKMFALEASLLQLKTQSVSEQDFYKANNLQGVTNDMINQTKKVNTRIASIAEKLLKNYTISQDAHSKLLRWKYESPASGYYLNHENKGKYEREREEAFTRNRQLGQFSKVLKLRLEILLMAGINSNL